MTKNQAIKWAGNAAKLAKALNITESAISQWDDYPPLLQQYRINALSNGQLKVTEKQKTRQASA